MNRPSRSTDTLGSEVFGVLGRSIPSRLIEISRSGCLLESARPVENGAVGELRLEVDGEWLIDDVRVTRCVHIEGAGSSHLIGAEFVQTRPPAERSIRLAITGILRGLVGSQAGAVKLHVKRDKRGEALTAAPVVNSQSTGEVS